MATRRPRTADYVHKRMPRGRSHLEGLRLPEDLSSTNMLLVAEMLTAEKQHTVGGQRPSKFGRCQRVDMTQINTVYLGANSSSNRTYLTCHNEPTVVRPRPGPWFCHFRARRSNAPITPFSTNDTTARTKTMANKAS